MRKNFVKLEKSDIDCFISRHTILVFKVRNSRIKSLQLAILEAFFLLKNFDPIVIKNPPLSEHKGIFALAFESFELSRFVNFFNDLGYSNEVYQVKFDDDFNQMVDITSCWKGKNINCVRIFKQDEDKFLAESPDKREFAILDNNNVVKKVVGYRGNGQDLGRRALPVEDCRMMINLSMFAKDDSLLDPFAGGGGIVFQARKRSSKLYSCDIDTSLKPGLELYGANHFVGDAINWKIDKPIQVLVTEIPFLLSVTNNVCHILTRLSDYLSNNSRIVVMCSLRQKEILQKEMSTCYYHCFSFDVNRKGTSVSVLYFTKSKNLFDEVTDLYNDVKYMY